MGRLMARKRAGRPQPRVCAVQKRGVVWWRSAQTRRWVQRDLNRTVQRGQGLARRGRRWLRWVLAYSRLRLPSRRLLVRLRSMHRSYRSACRLA